MRHYALFFSYTSTTWARMTSNPGDRTTAVQEVIQTLGGSLECLYWMLGEHDGIGIVHLPDSEHADLSALITRTGAFTTVQTHELLTQEQLTRTLRLASSASHAFQAPPASPGQSGSPGQRTEQPDRSRRPGRSSTTPELADLSAEIGKKTMTSSRPESAGRRSLEMPVTLRRSRWLRSSRVNRPICTGS